MRFAEQIRGKLITTSLTVNRCALCLTLCTSVVFLIAFPLSTVAEGEVANATEAFTFFQRQVLPLLREHCYACHSHEHETAEGGLVLDSRSGWRTGGDSGPAIVPGEPGKSLLLRAVSYQNLDLQMPPEGKLKASQIDVLRQWISDGAFDPRESIMPDGHAAEPGPPEQLWSLQPLAETTPPPITDESDSRSGIHNGIDHFIARRLRDTGLSALNSANRYTRLRRATFDLTGLPPTAAQIDSFLNDHRHDAWERLIDRLLSSPHYGERWGRHWLDLARYGDSNGGDINYAHANAWRYRDYVIRSFNSDTPYDTFIHEQLAGDLLPHHKDSQLQRQHLTATGFLMLGPKMLAEVDTEKLLIDIVDEQLDVSGRTFLGLTLGCARCHDHKFDPITSEDYYALAGIFRSTKVIDVLRPANGVSEWLEVDVTPAPVRQQIETLAKQRQRIEDELLALGAGPRNATSDSNAAPQAVVASELTPLRSTTWSVWVRIDSSQTLGAVVSASYEGAGEGHSLGFDRGRTPRVVWNHGSGPHTIIAAEKPLNSGAWHHLVVSCDASEHVLSLYVDGRLAVTATDVEAAAFDTLAVGRREASQRWQLHGDVDELLIFDEPLAPEHVARLALRQPVPISPVLHWSFDRVRDQSVLDSVGATHGQLVGLTAEASLVPDGVAGRGLRVGAKTPVPSQQTQERIRLLRAELQTLDAMRPEPTLVMAVAADAPVDLPIHIRGNHVNLRDRPIPRSSPRIFDRTLPGVKVPSHANGRLELARWITHPANPLTARVMVNRLWQHHFGNGLVRTPSNFGMRGERPTHPELLDWLAVEFIRSGWSIKRMHRLMMTSAAYQRSSQPHAEAERFDPDNRLLARFPIRRLEAESIRDALLAVSGELDHAPPGSLLRAPNKQRVKLAPDDAVYDARSRSVYLPVIRVRSYAMFSVFDVADNGQHLPLRPRTMVAQQALFLMNNPFVLNRVETLARRVAELPMPVADSVDWLSHTLYGRPATATELKLLQTAFVTLRRRDVPADSQFKSTRDADAFAWQQIVHTMICADEFIHVR